MTPLAVLRQGAAGEAVRDLQQRLAGAGHGCGPDELGAFGPATSRAVRRFQEERAIRVDGICGRETWAALVESGFALGDRLLYLCSPNLRGDDVTELQRTLNRLGFDAGREDGILGPQSATALREFQRNAGIAVDGVAGPATLDALSRVSRLAQGSVAAVRERERLREPRLLEGHRIYLAVAPGFEQIGTVVGKALIAQRAQVIADTSGADDAVLAERANRWPADLLVALRAGDRGGCRCLHFASGEFRSEAGYRIAREVARELAAVLGEDSEVCGRAYAVLRETRMAAVVCALVAEHDAAAMATLLASAAEVGEALSRGLRRGFEHTGEEPPGD